ncbi:MAG TPA: HAD-IIB family hydrolase [Burkholderiales bacterium]|nr:HAD-IIB family hydrolase [Burkholderiales bacterium]
MTKISALVSDVDGTLVTPDKILTVANRAAAARLGAAGIAFAIISSRPPRGLRMLTGPLALTTPMAGFNGGVFVTPKLAQTRAHLLEPALARRAVERIGARGAKAWVFTVRDWLVRDPDAPYVAHERRTVQFDPVVVDDFGDALGAAGKIVAVSEDFELLKRLEAEARAAFRAEASVARSQPYYLDFTHPLANKGTALLEFSKLLAIPPAEIAVIGDGGNDVAMFERAGLAIAMGNASAEVRAAADLVTGSNRDDGFAEAVERFILRREQPAFPGTP